MNIDHNSITPLYHQIKEELLSQIESQKIMENEIIPSEIELQKIFGVSRPTVRRAINELIQSGYLYRKRGVGTFVSKPKIERDAQVLLGFTEEMKQRGLKTKSVDISVTILQPSKILAEKLNLKIDDQVIVLKRLRFIDKEPIGIHTSYIPIDLLPNISVKEMNGIQSLYSLLENRFDFKIAYADETIEATAASEEEANLLSINPNSPILFVRRYVYLENNQLMEMAEMFYPANRYKYHAHLVRKP